ncbi:hypothetical protein B0H14DRAFT_120070 [Mycena olivaceomarginata]|nr:hypothetical protein B0H14DRAFT_120070 [Mycena olivaceomarginata]
MSSWMRFLHLHWGCIPGLRLPADVFAHHLPQKTHKDRRIYSVCTQCAHHPITLTGVHSDDTLSHQEASRKLSALLPFLSYDVEDHRNLVCVFKEHFVHSPTS